MKVFEAIDEIKRWTGILMSSGRCSLEMAEAQKIAIESLEKQIPKKPIDKTHPDNVCARIYENFDIIVCPTCGKRLKLKSKGKYCDKCGQAIDWSKV